jgi:hypothetical protein
MVWVISLRGRMHFPEPAVTGELKPRRIVKSAMDSDDIDVPNHGRG